MKWVVVSGHEKSLTAYAYGPFETLEAALGFINARPDGYASNVYQLRPASQA